MRAIRVALALFVICAASLVAPAGEAYGQVAVDPTISPPRVDPTIADPVDGSQVDTGSDMTPLFAPVPFKDSQIGWGLFLLAGLIHRFDPDTTFKPSTGVVGGFYTENESWGVMAAEMARLRQDRWRLRGMLSHMDIRYDFFGIGEDAGQAGKSIPLRQQMDMAVGAGLRRVSEGLYLGPSVLWMRTRVELQDQPAGLPTPPDRDQERTSLVAPGVQAEFDTRDDDYWPRSGSLANARTVFFTEGLGSSREFQRYMVTWSWYKRLRGDALILATNANGSAATGDAPFYMLPTIGVGKVGLRGYQQGRYRDRIMITLQAELRYHTQGRLGAAVFGGFGQVAPNAADLAQARVFPAGGAGLRFQLTRRYPMHLRADYAWGVGDQQFYFAVSEAF